MSNHSLVTAEKMRCFRSGNILGVSFPTEFEFFRAMGGPRVGERRRPYYFRRALNLPG